MKSKLFIASMLMTSISLFAQSSNNTYSEGWNTFYFQWNPSSFVPDEGESESYTGLSIGFNKAFSVSQNFPLYIEAGLGAQYSFYSKDVTEEVAKKAGVTTTTVAALLRPEEKMKMVSAKVPVSLAYAFHIPETKLTLIPYIGFDMRFNIIGKYYAKINLTSAGLNSLKQNGYTQKQIDEQFGDKDLNLFDKDDMGNDAATWNRFQVGWHIGLKACINNQFLIGASYGTDFSEIAQKVKIHTTSLVIGYCF